MKILNFGSLNIDYVYQVDHIVKPGETIDSYSLNLFSGGKGLNQSIAIARAGSRVYHAGMIGKDGDMLIKSLRDNDVECQYVKTCAEQTGSAVIQVDKQGQNCIILNGGANRKNTLENIKNVLADFEAGDILLLQNEINGIRDIIEIAKAKKMFIVLNPSPMNSTVLDCDLKKIDLFLMNEHEGAQITGAESVNEVLETMKKKFPQASVVLTLGAKGAVFQDSARRYKHKGYRVTVADTTAAGDTFTGYFISMLSQNQPIEKCIDEASKAAALAVMRSGAAVSIPHKHEIKTWSYEENS